ncbi:MAG TPA: hypothetical protein VNF50_02200 [Acidimicrobiales bacterium]|nr:hypothetical protein [Acidimicrobiales bacterium]
MNRSSDPVRASAGTGRFCSPVRLASDSSFKRLAGRLLPTGVGQWIFFGLVFVAVSLAPNLSRRPGLALAAVATLAGSTWCLVNFWRCREAHCIVSGLGWAGLGAFGLLETGLGHSLIGGYGGAVFIAVLVVAYIFEFGWRAVYGTNAVMPHGRAHSGSS